MTIKDNCDRWIQLAFNDWLHWVRNNKGSYLRVSTNNLVNRMQSAASDPDRSEEAWNLLERLKRLSDNFNKLEDVSKTDSFKYERPEAYLECALTSYRMGDLQEALRLFQIPVSEFQTRSLFRSISYWLYGCIQWQLPAHLEDAVISWERSLYVMQEAQSDNRNDLNVKNWCTNVINTMQKAINDATRLNSPPAPPAANPVRRQARTGLNPYRATLRTFPIIGSIPAGTPVEMDITPDDWLKYSNFEINGKHDCFSLRGGNQINIQPGKEYYLLKVTGNSMNLSTPVNIENGDFVFMVKQDVPNPGDIVAAEILGDDPEATLKRYLFENGYHILKPESDEAKFQQKMLMKQEFLIRGIALAVFKPAA